MIKGHPTTYKGIQLRSRLEARWCGYFDFRGWGWVYEPFELNGNYSPDFLINTQLLTGILVEVKPCVNFGQFKAPIRRILETGWKGPWMVVGADPDLCMEGIGRHDQHRRYLGTESPEAWAYACNVTQWKGPTQIACERCERCGLPDHPLHRLGCVKG